MTVPELEVAVEEALILRRHGVDVSERLAELTIEITEAIEARHEQMKELDAALWIRDFLYLEAEGFLTIEDERFYFKEDAWCPSSLPTSR